MLAGKIDGEQAVSGSVIPFGDLLIGATALVTGFLGADRESPYFKKSQVSRRQILAQPGATSTREAVKNSTREFAVFLSPNFLH